MFVGDTLVASGDGIPIQSLDGVTAPYVVGFEDNKPLSYPLQTAAVPFDAIQLVQVETWFAGGCRDCFHKTQKGLLFVCTPDQEFLLKNGSWVPARDLAPGARLRTVGRDCGFEEIKGVSTLPVQEGTSVYSLGLSTTRGFGIKVSWADHAVIVR